MLVGLIYRSSNGSDFNINLLSLINESCNINCTHPIIKGYFNCPYLTWDTLCTQGPNYEEQRFLECTRDNFLLKVIRSKPVEEEGADQTFYNNM